MVRRRFLSGLVAACVVSFGCGAALAQAASGGGMQMPKKAAPLSTSLTLIADGKTIKFSVADLKAMPQRTVIVHNEHTKADEKYTGPALSDLLAKAGFVENQTNHAKIVHSYIKAEGTDKYWVLYSAIEVEGSEHVGDVIVATSMDGKDLGADGDFKLVSTEDKKPQRWVRNLSVLTLKTAE
jgi:hypothetical protein